MIEKKGGVNKLKTRDLDIICGLLSIGRGGNREVLIGNINTELYGRLSPAPWSVPLSSKFARIDQP